MKIYDLHCWWSLFQEIRKQNSKYGALYYYHHILWRMEQFSYFMGTATATQIERFNDFKISVINALMIL